MSGFYITLPNGHKIGLRTYVQAWQALKTAPPHENVPGFNWYGTPAIDVLRAIWTGVQDRINRHDRTQRACSDRRLFTKIRNAAKRGAITYECRNCGSTLDYLLVNPNNLQSRYCKGCRT